MLREDILKEEISDRLQRALERAGNRSIRSLESAMRERESDITSYGAIRAYVQGEKLAPLTFLMEAAEELGIRPEWLILGEGEMTPVEEELGDQGLDELLASHSELGQWPPRAREIFVELLGSYVLQTPDHTKVTQTEIGTEVWAVLVRDLVFLTTLPLRSWGFREIEDLSHRERFTYLLSVLNGLLVAVKGKEDGDPLSDHAESLIPALRGAVEEPGGIREEELARIERLQQVLDSGGEAG